MPGAISAGAEAGPTDGEPWMTETGASEWRRRVRRDRDESARRRAARAALRRELATRRRHGLAARHATKLIRRDEAKD